MNSEKTSIEMTWGWSAVRTVILFDRSHWLLERSRSDLVFYADVRKRSENGRRRNGKPEDSERRSSGTVA